jgi:two-component system phosphate regulon response regulator OmpR
MRVIRYLNNDNPCPRGQLRACALRSAHAHTPQRHAAPAGMAKARTGAANDGPRTRAIPRVLHIDADASTALVLSTLLMPEARVTCVPTLELARRALLENVFSLVVIDPSLPDGDAATLLPFLAGTPMLVYAANAPDWRTPASFLPKPWTSARQLWVTISGLLGITHAMTAGD